MNYRKKNLVELEYPVGGVAAVGGGGAVVPVPLHNVAPFHRLAIHNIHFTPFFTKISENIYTQYFYAIDSQFYIKYKLFFCINNAHAKSGISNAFETLHGTCIKKNILYSTLSQKQYGENKCLFVQ